MRGLLACHWPAAQRALRTARSGFLRVSCLLAAQAFQRAAKPRAKYPALHDRAWHCVADGRCCRQRRCRVTTRAL
eukprot:4323411-Prymnesium_polylepis.1